MTSRRAILGFVVLVVVLAALGVALAGIVIRDQPRSYETPLDGFACTEDPRQLRIFTGVGPGDHIVSTDVREDRDKVVITVRAVDPEPRDVFQQLSLTLTNVTVALKDPLGGRLVFDQNGQTLQGQCP